MLRTADSGKPIYGEEADREGEKKTEATVSGLAGALVLQLWEVVTGRCSGSSGKKQRGAIGRTPP